MKFPGRRKIKHYFPVNTHNRFDMESSVFGQANTYVCGIDQNLVDITARVDDSALRDFALDKGASQWLDNDRANSLYRFLKKHQLIEDQFAGGTIGNTLHNYSVLADDRSVQFGVMSNNIQVGDYAYRYLCNTSSKWISPGYSPLMAPLAAALPELPMMASALLVSAPAL